MTRKRTTAEEEYELYKDPEYQRPEGPGRRRASKFTELVPIRLTREALDDVRRLAEAEDRSVSSWIRRAVQLARTHNEGQRAAQGGPRVRVERLGEFRALRNADALRIEDWPTALENLQALPGLGKRAKADGYWIEAISVRAYFYEFALKLWIAACSSDPRKVITKRSTLGHLVREAAKAGLKGDLVAVLRRFNDGRNAAIHGLLSGRIRYAQLAEVLADDPRYDDLLDAVYTKLPPERLAR